jgi:hypothetical protein
MLKHHRTIVGVGLIAIVAIVVTACGADEPTATAVVALDPTAPASPTSPPTPTDVLPTATTAPTSEPTSTATATTAPPITPTAAPVNTATPSTPPANRPAPTTAPANTPTPTIAPANTPTPRRRTAAATSTPQPTATATAAAVLTPTPSSTPALIEAKVALMPSQDTTLFEDDENGNGAGEFFFAGNTNQPQMRRGLLAFDIAGGIPAGATVTAVSLTLSMSRSSGPETPVALHRVLTAWGEGASDARREEGSGATATDGDATWLQSSLPDALWTSPGGDFDEAATASIVVGRPETYTWDDSPGMIADVQSWLDDPSTNFGWIVIGDETRNQTAKRFDSRENADEDARPRLIVEIAEP